jgi:hypothetical protein
MDERVGAARHTGIDGPAPSAGRLSTAKVVTELFQLPDDAVKFPYRQPGFEPFSRLHLLSRQGNRNPTERLRVVAVRVTQFVHKCLEHIDLADAPELDSDTLEPPAQPDGHLRFELEHWQNFAQTTGRDTSSVERAHVALLELM